MRILTEIDDINDITKMRTKTKTEKRKKETMPEEVSSGISYLAELLKDLELFEELKQTTTKLLDVNKELVNKNETQAAALKQLRDQRANTKLYLEKYRARVLSALENEEPYPAEVPDSVRAEITKNLRYDAFSVHTESLRILDVVLTQRLISKVQGVPFPVIES